MRLIYQRGDERIAFPLDEGETYIGRKDDCDIYFPDTSLSKRHARLVRKGGALHVHDAGSKNGTLVNGEVIEGGVPVQDGDVIQCGKLAFTVEGVSGGEFDIVEDESSRESGGGAAVVSRKASGSKSAPTARAVRSGEVRGSVLDEFPELPLSGEGAGAERAGPTARFRLVEGGEPRSWDLTGETITIGSKAENAIVISGDGISRYHAEVLHEGGRWVLKDLGARNGLFVAGNKIELHELQDGDEVQIGTVKLRFEAIKPSPFDDVKALAAALKKDPVGTFKREPRVRIAAACVVFGAALLFMAMPAGGPGGGGVAGGDVEWIIDGTKMLEAGNYTEARNIFRKQQVHVQSHQQHLPRKLTDLATLYATLSDGAMKFRWDRAEALLIECASLDGLPDRTQTWIGSKMGEARSNHEAYLEFEEAKKAGAEAMALADPTQKKYREALRAFEIAITRFGEVPGTSAYGPPAREMSTRMRSALYQMVVTHARELMSAASPDWQGVVRFLAQAQGYAETSEQQRELQSIKSECETNQRDEDYYQTAVDIVGIRDVDSYPKAVRLLERVDRRSRIYPDAQAYIQWIDADLKVRQAQVAYQLGDEKRAFKLLNEALLKEVLGPEARASVRSRRQTWGRVVTAFQRGSEMLDDGRTREAQEEFERVIQLEPNRENRYHKNSIGHLKHLQELAGLSLERKLREGLDALDNQQYDGAFRFFGEVTRDPNKQPRDLQKIQEAVVNANRSRRLLKNAQRDFTADHGDKFLEIYYVTKLLKTWLPDGDRGQRDDAKKLYEQVLKRLKTLQMISGQVDEEGR